MLIIIGSIAWFAPAQPADCSSGQYFRIISTANYFRRNPQDDENSLRSLDVGVVGLGACRV